MLLTIDIGNTTTVFGCFEGERLKKKWTVPSLKLKTQNSCLSGRQAKLLEVVISSVVPSKDKIIKKNFPQAYFITASNIKGIGVRAVKREVGADRVVNALAAKEIYGTPAIVIDFGTATTFDVISAKGEYLGGAIAPGIGLSAKILHEATAKLPQISLRASNILIGKNTRDAINSGLLYGYVSMVEGMIWRIKSKIQMTKSKENSKSKIQIIATGGCARLIAKYTKAIDVVDSDLTLKGLRLAYLNSLRYNK